MRCTLPTSEGEHSVSGIPPLALVRVTHFVPVSMPLRPAACVAKRTSAIERPVASVFSLATICAFKREPSAAVKVKLPPWLTSSRPLTRMATSGRRNCRQRPA